MRRPWCILGIRRQWTSMAISWCAASKHSDCAYWRPVPMVGDADNTTLQYRRHTMHTSFCAEETTMQACQQMCEVLIEAGIDHVFGIPGGGTSPCSMPSTTIATRSA